MKIAVIQPEYSFRSEDLDRCFREMVGLLDSVDESYDLIVLPEYSDIPAATKGAKAFLQAIETYNESILNKAAEAARRCHAMVFVNAAHKTEDGWRNTTHAMDREGRIVGRYYKAHPAPSEERTAERIPGGLDVSYSYDYAPAKIVEMEGLRFAFLTCYDFYMYELIPVIAKQKPDIIIGCSHQRTDTHNALDLFGRFTAYQTNAWLVRSAVSLGKDSEVCGCSMVVSPKGEMRMNMKNDVGVGTIEIDP
ncbi:MAG: carbon-nitrogen hydrolase family protein, partial [Lachnospiraceae bacterium]|nr:carbon-nitrogen hydrolase family protein [Lachnospiraceae bacterium]